MVNKREGAGLKLCNDSKSFIEYSNDMDDIYENINEYTPHKKRKILIVFDDMTTDVPSNKKRQPVATELLLGDRKLNISLVFITQFYFFVTKNITLNPTRYFITKIRIKK